MSIVDKHGGYWHQTDDQGDLIFENYDKDSGLIGAIRQQPTGLYVACLYEKIEDPAFDSPVWSEIKPVALFNDLDEAKTHVMALIAKRR